MKISFHLHVQFQIMSVFKRKKNRSKVENPYGSLGLPQQTMMISHADHGDLFSSVPSSSIPKSLVNKKVDLCRLWGGGVWVHPLHPPPYGPEYPWSPPIWPCGAADRAVVIYSSRSGFNSNPGQSFSLFLSGLNFMTDLCSVIQYITTLYYI